MADVIFNALHKYLLNGSVDLLGDTIKVMLCTATYVPNRDTHAYRDDVTNEITGTGYVSGGVTLGTKSVTQDDTNDLARFDAADAEWPGADFSASWAVLYKARGGAAGVDELICAIDLEALNAGDPVEVSGVAFVVQWSVDGILTLKVA